MTAIAAAAPDTTVLSAPCGNALWADGEPTEYGIEVYTAGDCWALAWHVAAQTGGRLHTVGDWPGWEHVVVEVAPCVFLDATGIHTGADVRKSWLSNRIVPMDSSATRDLGAFEEALQADFVYLSSHREAEEFARLLVDKHLPVASPVINRVA